ncbi:MAG: hypothetical protein JWP25_2002 [Bradyrhizobium sp.]|nr:hypothetical protein [Bradyrhizobium sp.]
MTTTFIERMKLHWKTQSMPCTKALIEGWLQLEQAIDDAADQRRWQVLQLPTGTGKTDALIALCATPTLLQHPGALVITRFTDEADRIAQKINQMSGLRIALATHQHTTENALAMAESPVLVITHSAYRSALREAHNRAGAAHKLDLYLRYQQAMRTWLIVDEAFNWIDAYEADVDAFIAMCSALSVQMRNNPNLNLLLTFVIGLSDAQNTERSDRLVRAEHFMMLEGVNFEELRLAIKALPAEATELWRRTELHLRPVAANEKPRRTTFREEYVKLLDQLHAIQQMGRAWVSRRSARTRLHSSRLLLDTKRPCGVILDATASVDQSYDLYGSCVALVPRPVGIRSYGNVTVHVSRPHHVGKERLIRDAATDWPALAQRLETKLADTSKVLVITHKDIAGIVEKRGLRRGKLYVAHWGALDGKNDWRECDTVVIYGLPYLDDIAPTDLFHACTGLWSSDWFEGQRGHCGEVDMKIAIKNKFIAKSVIQAFNRGRPRTIIDGQGNCAPTDVFMLLPRGKTADEVIGAIQEEMPGAKMVQWAAASEIKKSLSHNESRLVAELQTCKPGIYTKSQIVARLSIAARTFERLSVNIQKQDSVLMRELIAIGVEYDCTIGRGKEACFNKK